MFSRFDFNGDGLLSKTEFALVPLKPDGSPATSKIDENLMTDLGVMQSQWDSDLDKTEGYSASDLPGLMYSADLELHADDLFSEGASDVVVSVIRLDTNEVLPSRIIPVGDFIVYTVPAGVDLKIVGSTIIGGELGTFKK